MSSPSEISPGGEGQVSVKVHQPQGQSPGRQTGDSHAALLVFFVQVVPQIWTSYCAEIRTCCRRDKFEQLLLPQIIECLSAC
jgi:hypothetical protein